MSKRKEILVIKIVDFRKDKDVPSFDVEIYKSGKFTSDDCGVFSTIDFSDGIALKLAKEHAHKYIANLELKEE